MAKTDDLPPEDPEYWCDKEKRSGKYKGKVCGRNLNHRGDCEWYHDEERTQPVEDRGEQPAEAAPAGPLADVIPFKQPTEMTVTSETLGPQQVADFLPPQGDEVALTAEQATADMMETAKAALPVIEQIVFNAPASAPVFEEPDLRGKDGYQHPVTGEKVPGVTSISGLLDKSSYLTPWSAKLAAEWAAPNVELLAQLPDVTTRVAVIKKHAEELRHHNRDLGSLAHNTIEAIIRGEEVKVDPRIQPQVDGFREWFDKFVGQIVLSEATVWSDVHKFAGTMDLAVVLKDGRLVCVDIKTGKDVHEDAALQINALIHAESIISTAGQVPNLPFIGGGVLHLPQPIKTATGRDSVRGKWSYRPIDKSAEDWSCFLALRHAYGWEKGRGRQAIGGKQTTLPGVPA